MGLNIVESFIVAACADHLVRRRLVSPMDAKRVDEDALEVVAMGMKQAGFRFVPGILRSPWGYFYEGMAGVNRLRGWAA